MAPVTFIYAPIKFTCLLEEVVEPGEGLYEYVGTLVRELVSSRRGQGHRSVRSRTTLQSFRWWGLGENTIIR